MEIDRPLDLLNELKGKMIKVILKSKEEIIGTLVAWDIYINLVLEDIGIENAEIIFIKGDGVSAICPIKK